MKTFLVQTATQAAVIALLWCLVARDAARLRQRHGTTPSGVTPFAWGALCGLTWVALIPYFLRRSRPSEIPPGREQNLLRWWIGLAVLAGVWSAVNGAQGDANNAAQHALLAATFVVCALIAWTRDRGPAPAQPRPSDLEVVTSDEHT